MARKHLRIFLGWRRSDEFRKQNKAEKFLIAKEIHEIKLLMRTSTKYTRNVIEESDISEKPLETESGFGICSR